MVANFVTYEKSRLHIAVILIIVNELLIIVIELPLLVFKVKIRKKRRFFPS